MFYSAQPGRKTIANDVIDRMNSISHEGRTPNQFELAAIRREIAKLKKRKIASFYDLSGMLAALNLDLETTRSNHVAAIRVSGNDPYYRSHYAVSLTKHLLFDEAISILEDLVENDPADLDSLDTLINLATSTGHYRLANKWIDVWSQRCPKKMHDDADMLKTQIIPFLDELEIDDEDVGAVFKRAMDVLVENKKPFGDIGVRWPGEKDDSPLCITVYMREPIEVIADLISQYCDLEAENERPGKIVNKIMVTFSPMAA